jgi:hypothetical protein
LGYVLTEYKVEYKMNYGTTVCDYSYEEVAQYIAPVKKFCPVSYPKDASPCSPCVSLDCTTAVGNNSKKNNTMYYDFRDNLKPEQIHLLKRASTVNDKLMDAAFSKFMKRPARPTSPQALVDAIKGGDIRVLTKQDDEYNRYAGPLDNIIFSASFKTDEAGYDAEMKTIKDAYTEAKDLIIVSEPADGLKALNAFEATA